MLATSLAPRHDGHADSSRDLAPATSSLINPQSILCSTLNPNAAEFKPNQSYGFAANQLFDSTKTSSLPAPNISAPPPSTGPQIVDNSPLPDTFAPPPRLAPAVPSYALHAAQQHPTPSHPTIPEYDPQYPSLHGDTSTSSGESADGKRPKIGGPTLIEIAQSPMLKQELRRNPEDLRLLLSYLPPFDVIKAGYLSYEFTFPVKSVFDCKGRPYFHNEIYIGRGGDPNNPMYHGNMIKPRDFHNVLDEEPDGLIICIRIHVGVVLSEEWRYQRTVHDLAGKLPVCHCPTGTPCHGWADVWISNARRSELTYWIDLIRLSPYGPRASGFTIRAPPPDPPLPPIPESAFLSSTHIALSALSVAFAFVGSHSGGDIYTGLAHDLYLWLTSMVSPPALTDSRSKIITLLTDTAARERCGTASRLDTDAINLLALFTVQTWRRDMAPYFPTRAPTPAELPLSVKSELGDSICSMLVGLLPAARDAQQHEYINATGALIQWLASHVRPPTETEADAALAVSLTDLPPSTHPPPQLATVIAQWLVNAWHQYWALMIDHNHRRRHSAAATPALSPAPSACPTPSPPAPAALPAATDGPTFPPADPSDGRRPCVMWCARTASRNPTGLTHTASPWPPQQPTASSQLALLHGPPQYIGPALLPAATLHQSAPPPPQPAPPPQNPPQPAVSPHATLAPLLPLGATAPSAIMQQPAAPTLQPSASLQPPPQPFAPPSQAHKERAEGVPQGVPLAGPLASRSCVASDSDGMPGLVQFPLPVQWPGNLPFDYVDDKLVPQQPSPQFAPPPPPTLGGGAPPATAQQTATPSPQPAASPQLPPQPAASPQLAPPPPPSLGGGVSPASAQQPGICRTALDLARSLESVCGPIYRFIGVTVGADDKKTPHGEFNNMPKQQIASNRGSGDWVSIALKHATRAADGAELFVLDFDVHADQLQGCALFSFCETQGTARTLTRKGSHYYFFITDVPPPIIAALTGARQQRVCAQRKFPVDLLKGNNSWEPKSRPVTGTLKTIAFAVIRPLLFLPFADGGGSSPSPQPAASQQPAPQPATPSPQPAASPHPAPPQPVPPFLPASLLPTNLALPAPPAAPTAAPHGTTWLDPDTNQSGLSTDLPALNRRVNPDRVPNSRAHHTAIPMGDHCRATLGKDGRQALHGLPEITAQSGVWGAYCQVKSPGHQLPGQRGAHVTGKDYKAAVRHVLNHYIKHPAPPGLCLTCFLSHPGEQCVNRDFDWGRFLDENSPRCRCGTIHYPPCPRPDSA